MDDIPVPEGSNATHGSHAPQRPAATSQRGPEHALAPSKSLGERHIGIMAISGMLGTGLFLTSGRSLADAGPAGALLGYIVVRSHVRTSSIREAAH